MSSTYGRMFFYQERARWHGEMAQHYIKCYQTTGVHGDLVAAMLEAREAGHYGSLYLTTIAPIQYAQHGQDRVEELVFAANEGMRPIASYSSPAEVFVALMTLALRFIRANRKSIGLEAVRSTAYRLILEVEPTHGGVM